MQKINYHKMGTRLKELRTEMGLSHEKLAARLEEQMGVRISRDSLMNYEGKPDKCPGMRIEYILALSALYGVSTDYILGIADHKSISEDAQTATNYVGLSEDVVSTLYAASHIADLENLQVPLSKSATAFLDRVDFSPFDQKLVGELMLSFCESLVTTVFEDPVSFGQYLCHLKHFVDHYGNLSYQPADETISEIHNNGFALLPAETYSEYIVDKLFDVLKQRAQKRIFADK